MAMMAKMRSLAPAFILTVGVVFVLFMVISDSRIMEIFGAHSQNVGSINGDDISYQEFVKAVDQQRETQKNQNGQDIEEDQMDMFRDQVWDALVTQKLIAEQVKKYGITVTDEEVRDVILGDNPPEFLKRNFVDSLGNFNRQLYQQAIFDPRNKNALIQAEEYVKQQRLNEKLQSMLLASITAGEDEVKQKFIDQSISMNAVYLLADLNQFGDNEVKVTDEDIKDYYNKNQDKYHIDASRKLKYVMFPFTASSEDSAVLARNMESVLDRMKKNDTLTLKSAAEMYSQYPYSKDSMNIGMLPVDVSDKLQSAAPGSIIGPVSSREGMAIYKLDGVVTGKDEYVHAQHILIQGSDETAKAEADKVYNAIKSGANFNQMAAEKSADKSNSMRGGDLGWFGKGAMVKEFETACFNAKPGELLAPVKTQFGWHIIKVIAKSDKKFVVEKIVAPIKPSAATKDAKYSLAQDFAYVADKNGLEKEAQLLKYGVQETPPFQKEAYGIPGIGANKAIVDFGFNESKGSVSQPFKTQGGYVVVMVSDVIQEGTRPFDEVKQMIKPLVVREKKYAKAKDLIVNVKKQINGNLAAGPSVNNKVVFDTTGPFTMSGTIAKLGRDYAVMDAAMTLKPGTISEPIKGQRGYFVIQVLNRSQFDKAAYQSQRASLVNNLLQEKKGAFFNQWLNKLKKDAKIVDNRHKFFNQ